MAEQAWASLRGSFTASWVAVLAITNTPEASLLFPLYSLHKQRSLSQSDIKVHWSVNIYQQIKTERGKLGTLENPSSILAVCVWTETRVLMSFLCDSSQTENTHAGSTLQPTTASPLMKSDDAKLWQTEADPISPRLQPSSASAFRLGVFCSV